MKTSHPLFVVPLALVSAWFVAWSSERAPEYVESPTNTFWVSCGDHPPYRSRTATSQSLVSPDGAYRAYARVTAKAQCANTSRVFVRGPHDANYKQIFLQGPKKQAMGNGVRVVDWSPDSRLLLIEVIVWQYGSDADVDRKILIYDAPARAFMEADFDGILKDVPNDCWSSVRALGFSASNQVVIQALVRPYYDPGDETPRNPSCPTKSEKWLIGAKGEIQNAGRDYEPSVYGKRSQ